MTIVKPEELLPAMNDLHSLLSLVRHRHLPRGLDSLEKDIDKALATSEGLLKDWWREQMAKPKQKCLSTYTHSSLGKLACEQDEGHLSRRGDVEHTGGGIKWMSV